jgi:hypothetical protein
MANEQRTAIDGGVHRGWLPAHGSNKRGNGNE